jgi:hypothetical protein
VASFIEAEAPVHFVMAPVSRGPIVRAVEAKGIINPEQTFLINPVVAGSSLQFSPSGIGAPPALPAGQSRVWVLRDGKPTAVPLKLGLGDHHFSEVIEGGLKPDESVIIAEKSRESAIRVLEEHF